MVVGDLVIVNASDESQAIIGLDKKTGKTVWRTNRSIDFQDLDKNGKPFWDRTTLVCFSEFARGPIINPPS